MSVLPSFKSAFSSLAEADTPTVRIAEDSGIPRSSSHRPWSPLHTSSSDHKRPPSNTSPCSRPAVPPLPLDSLVGEAPAFGFARSEKQARPTVDPLPLEVLGLPVDGLVYVRTQSKPTTSPTVHAGAYKRPRRHSVSAGTSYVKVSSQPSSEPRQTPHTPKLHDPSSASDVRDPSTSNPIFRQPKPRDSTLPHLSASLSSSAHVSAPSETRPTLPTTLPTTAVPPTSTIPRINNLKSSNIVSFAPPSITRSAGSKGQVLSFHTQTTPVAAIIEDSTSCRVPIDVLSSPMQRSLNSAATGRTGLLRGHTGLAPTVSRGPTASDLSHLLGPRRNVNEDDVVDGTDNLPRETHQPASQSSPLGTSQPLQHADHSDRDRNVADPEEAVIPKSQVVGRESNALLPTQHAPQPPQPPPVQQPSQQQANGTASLSVGVITLRRTSNHTQNGDKLGHVGHSFSHSHPSTVTQSQGKGTREGECRPEPWRQEPRPQPINGLVHSQPVACSSRGGHAEYVRTSSSHLTLPYESRDTPYSSTRAPSFENPERTSGGQWDPSLRLSRSIGFPDGRRPLDIHGAFMPNGSLTQRAIPHQDLVSRTRVMNGNGGQLNNLLGTDTRDDMGTVQCPHCPRKLRNQVTLQNHIRVVHDHSGNFRCPQCSLTFMWRSTLGNHVRLVHEKQRPYACEQCAKAFRWKSHLREHFWVVHKGEKPFRCETCGKTFGRKNNMQKHMRKHTESAS